MQREDSWITGHYLDGRGSAEKMNGALLPADMVEGRCVWIQLNMNEFAAKIWLREESKLPQVAVEALLADETRPRCLPVDNGILINLRGVNLNPGADPADMIAIRMWVEEKKVVTVQRRRLRAVNDVEKHLADGMGPKDTGELLADLADSLAERMSQVIGDINHRIDDLEETILDENEQELRANLRALRREIIGLRRYLAPQREALTRLANEEISWMRPAERQHVREDADLLTRYIEDLDMARERAAVIQDELNSNMSERMNKNTYLLSIVAGIFLPLTFITGLLGINVAGIPYAESPVAFTIVTVLLAVLGAGGVAWLRRLHWI